MAGNKELGFYITWTNQSDYPCESSTVNYVLSQHVNVSVQSKNNNSKYI